MDDPLEARIDPPTPPHVLHQIVFDFIDWDHVDSQLIRLGRRHYVQHARSSLRGALAIYLNAIVREQVGKEPHTAGPAQRLSHHKQPYEAIALQRKILECIYEGAPSYSAMNAESCGARAREFVRERIASALETPR